MRKQLHGRDPVQESLILCGPKNSFATDPVKAHAIKYCTQVQHGQEYYDIFYNMASVADPDPGSCNFDHRIQIRDPR
jgi:hypothetical protein